MKEYTEDYLQNVKDIVSRKDEDAARRLLSDLHPADIAELFDDLEVEDAEFLNKLLDEETAAEVLMELDEDDRKKLLDNMPKEEIAKQLEHLDTDDAVDLIQELDEEDRDEVISQIDDMEQAGEQRTGISC